MVIGTFGALLLIWLSPTIQVDILHAHRRWFPLRNPALVTIPLSFLTGVVVSLATAARSQDEIARFPERERTMLEGTD